MIKRFWREHESLFRIPWKELCGAKKLIKAPGVSLPGSMLLPLEISLAHERGELRLITSVTLANLYQVLNIFQTLFYGLHIYQDF